ncbi:S41 family peptidase [Phenylobacterium sp.]|uniref:S41 family peptidase n=1 Tax=Phenylobacterium sp. TaxID=1871053 RepID=UPI0035B291D6
MKPLILAAALLAAGPAWSRPPAPEAGAARPAAVDPRAAALRIADLIEQTYFDPAKARRIAEALRAEAQRGGFDALRDPRDLAGVLSDRLKPEDPHFVVLWTPSAPAPVASAPVVAAQAHGPGPAEAAGEERRANYGVSAVEVRPGGIGYVRLDYFADFDQAADPEAPARRAADAAMALTANADAMIVDLRGNGGGSPVMVGYLAGYFVPAGADVYNTFKSRGPDEYERPLVEPRGPRRLKAPLYILVSGRTGSAAESFAYTLQAAGRATIVGEPTAGAANPGDLHAAGDGLSVFISEGRPVNPITKTNWGGAGVRPDAPCPAAKALTCAEVLALKALLNDAPSGEAAVERRWTLEALLAPPAPADAAALSAYAGEFGSRTIAVEDGRLALHRGRRPALILAGLAPDLFTVEGQPLLRFRFERDASGKVAALVQSSADGEETRLLRAVD